MERAIMPQEWPTISLEKGLQIICQQYKYVVSFNTTHGTMVCVGNTLDEYKQDFDSGVQYCVQNNIKIDSLIVHRCESSYPNLYRRLPL